jgi:hypothetical protein
MLIKLKNLKPQQRLCVCVYTCKKDKLCLIKPAINPLKNLVIQKL